jgi:hypothetical protein
MSENYNVNECNEKAVKMLVENHRLMLTFVGLLIAGLFAYGGRGSSVLEWRYFLALGCFSVSAFAIVLSVSVAIDQARTNKYEPTDKAMRIPYATAQILLIAGAVFAAWALIAPQRDGPVRTGVVIEGTKVMIGPDSKLKVVSKIDAGTGKVTSIEVAP